MNKYWLFIVFLFLFINIICYIYHEIKKKGLSKREIELRKKNLKNYNLVVLSNICLVVLLSTFYLIFSDNFSYNLNFLEIILQIILLLIINDTWIYWFHRMQHRISFFHKMHSIHHKVIKSLPMDYIYTNPIELLISFFGIIIPFLFFKINYISFIITVILRQIHEIDIHSNDNSKSLFLIFNSPSNHDKHHTPGKKGNYASMFPFWDIIMKTKIK